MRSAILTGLAAAVIATPLAFATLAICGASLGASVLLTAAAAVQVFVFVSVTEIDQTRRNAS